MAVDEVVVVGGALAGLRSVESLRAGGFSGPVTVLASEGPQAHDRPPLSKGFLTGAVDEAAFLLGPQPELATQWRGGVRAEAFDLPTRTLTTDTGEQLQVDGLVIATGLRPHRLRCLPDGLAGVHVLRGLADARALREDLRPGVHVTVVGSGFIGTEIASTCRSMGLDVTVVALEPPLDRVLGVHATDHQRRCEEHGVRFRLGDGVVGARERDGRVTAVVLGSGEVLATDVVVVAVGGAPEVGWLQGSGLPVDDGVLCGPDGLVVGADRVAAAGDVARCHSPITGTAVRVEHWTNATETAAVAAAGLLGLPAPAVTAPSFWSDQFGGRIQGVGLPAHGDEQVLVSGDVAAGRFVLESRREGRLMGAVVSGSPRALLSYRRDLLAEVAAA